MNRRGFLSILGVALMGCLHRSDQQRNQTKKQGGNPYPELVEMTGYYSDENDIIEFDEQYIHPDFKQTPPVHGREFPRLLHIVPPEEGGQKKNISIQVRYEGDLIYHAEAIVNPDPNYIRFMHIFKDGNYHIKASIDGEKLQDEFNNEGPYWTTFMDIPGNEIRHRYENHEIYITKAHQIPPGIDPTPMNEIKDNSVIQRSIERLEKCREGTGEEIVKFKTCFDTVEHLTEMGFNRAAPENITAARIRTKRDLEIYQQSKELETKLDWFKPKAGDELYGEYLPGGYLEYNNQTYVINFADEINPYI